CVKRYTERCVLKSFVSALPGTGKAVHVDNMRICARRLVDEPFEIALKKNVLYVGLLAAHVVGKGDHVIPQPRPCALEFPETDSIPGDRVYDRRIWGAVLPIV